MAGKEAVTYHLDADGAFVIEQYNRSKPFASFFPGIAGRHGIPMWTFYVNRGQGICSMGLRDKEQPIMEFLSANRAYQITSNQGFRTFIKVTRNGTTEYYEPFQQRLTDIGMDRVQRMKITADALSLEEVNKTIGLKFTVDYFNVPEDTYPGLVRILRTENIGKGSASIEVLDGLPMIIPYGVDNFNLKNMRWLVESFVETINYGRKVPFFKGKVKQEDNPEIQHIKQGNFYLGFVPKGAKSEMVTPVIDPRAIFGSISDYAYPELFMIDTPFKVTVRERDENCLPCAMGLYRSDLKEGASHTYYSIIGHCPDVKSLNQLVPAITKTSYIEAKQMENKKVVDKVAQCNHTVSRVPEFDMYCRQNFLDNVLRGGIPITFEGRGKRTALHLYSRKHGDMERDYNFYVLSPTNYAQGNGNYRDINQNRRTDLFVNPDIKADNVEHFYNLIQLDGFNPLGVGATAFTVTDRKHASALLKKAFSEEHAAIVKKLIKGHFQPGVLFAQFSEEKVNLKLEPDVFLGELLACCTKYQETDYGHSYWSDHWTYNIDLLENYLAVFPENLREILMERKTFTFFDNAHRVAPRKDKYVLWDGKPMQLGAVFFDKEKEALIQQRAEDRYAARTNAGQGDVYATTLMNKLLCIVANKFASLDTAGVGIEMESDKPNWYDALNGLPGLLGSSLSETLELKRLILFVLDAMEELDVKDSHTWPIAVEIKDFLDALNRAVKKHLVAKNKIDDFTFWDRATSIKEGYREIIRLGVSGDEAALKAGDLRAFLKLALEKIERGIQKAYDPKRGVISTYFMTEVVEYKVITESVKGKSRRQPKTNERGMPCFELKKHKHTALPLFLEGPVHYLRIEKDRDKARKLAQGIRKSGLYDRKLKMYKVNEDLTSQAMEIGRCRTFSRGWLENESIWLHMEYKYMLELLRSGLYEEFFADFKNVLVPFMDPQVYGRSILENSSFIASSANPNPDIHGNGFVARLSGSTAEFVHLLTMMTIGEKPFSINEAGELQIQFKPVLPSWLFTASRRVEHVWNGDKREDWVCPANSFGCTFLGNVRVTYRNPLKRNTFGPKAVSPQSIRLIDDKRGKSIQVEGDVVSGPLAEMIRKGQFKRIEIELK